MASGGNCSSNERLFTVADAIVNIPSIKAARLNRKVRSSNLQQNKSKTENREQGTTDFPDATPEIH